MQEHKKSPQGRIWPEEPVDLASMVILLRKFQMQLRRPEMGVFSFEFYKNMIIESFYDIGAPLKFNEIAQGSFFRLLQQ